MMVFESTQWLKLIKIAAERKKRKSMIVRQGNCAVLTINTIATAPIRSEAHQAISPPFHGTEVGLNVSSCVSSKGDVRKAGGCSIAEIIPFLGNQLLFGFLTLR